MESSSRSGRFIVEPSSGLLYEPAVIRGDGFEANEKLTVAGRFICENEDFDFTSIAHISTDSSGCFDLRTTPSVGGTYTGVEQMGMFWSMKQNCKQKFVRFANATNLLFYIFYLYKGHINVFDKCTPISECFIERSIMKSDITRTEIEEDGIKGTLFIPIGRGPFAATVTLLGATKHQHVIEDYAAFLANFGIVTLALAFFGVKGLPARFDTQPIDIKLFEKAIHFLESLDYVSNEHIGVIGSSKGGDIALAMSSFLPQVKFCCMLNGHISSVGTSTVYKKETIQQIKPLKENKKFLSENVLDISECLEDPRNQPESIHPFIRSNADMLFILGEKDLSGNVSLCADIFVKKLREAHKNNFKVLRFLNLGHSVFLPNVPIITKGPHPLLPKNILIAFGEPDCINDHAKTMLEVWSEVIAFVCKHKPLLSNL